MTQGLKGTKVVKLFSTSGANEGEQHHIHIIFSSLFSYYYQKFLSQNDIKYAIAPLCPCAFVPIFFVLTKNVQIRNVKFDKNQVVLPSNLIVK